MLKRERIKKKIYGTREEARSDIFDYIEVFIGMVLAIRCHRKNMKTIIINGSEVSRLAMEIQNHVERLWQAPHDTITCNHQCRSMWQLFKKFRHFMETVNPFPGGKYGLAKV